MSQYLELEEIVSELKCEKCSGLGTFDDAEPGDISFNTYKCDVCNGTGLHTPRCSGAPVKILPMATAPKDGTFILLFALSGYSTTPLRCEICHYSPEYRPLDPWQNHGCDSFRDYGSEPIGWLPLPEQDGG